MQQKTADNSLIAWITRLIKGIVIGTGFIIPGVSGGVFAVIFGVYEPMIRFFANIRKDFWKNVRFFLPIGVGVMISIVLCSKVLDRFFEAAAVPLVWFFIGCVVGTLPSLFKQAGKQGRTNLHYGVLVATMAAMCAFLWLIQGWLTGVSIPLDNIWVWLMAGALMGLGAIVPGLSPSNFLIYMNIYADMTERMGALNWMVIIPVVVGAMLCFLLLSKAFDKLFEKAYAAIYHCILGVVLASTVMIIPLPGSPMPGAEAGNAAVVTYGTELVIFSILACVVGVALGYGMSLLEKKYKSE
jgi:putative membrane protein